MKPEVVLEKSSQTSGYTLAEAEKMLPLIEAIAAEITARHDERRRLHSARASLEAARSPEGLSTSLGDIQTEIFVQTEGIHAAMDELVHLDLSILRLNPVTVHIPGRSAGRPVVFCWQVGDTSIGHGHELGEENDPRRPLKVTGH